MTFPPPTPSQPNKREVLRFFNRRPMPANAYRVLFNGGSLTFHAPLAGIWGSYGGMAASALERDYVHLFVEALARELQPRPVEPLINGAGYLRELTAQLSDLVGPPPDVVVIQGGESDPWNEAFPLTYENFATDLGRVGATPGCVIVLGDWYSPERSRCSQEIARRHGWPWIDLHAIHQNPGHCGDGGPYAHAGVATHPNDVGMQAIADALMQAWRTARAKAR